MAGPKRSRKHRRVREAPAPGYGAPPPVLQSPGILLDSDVIIEVLRGRKWACQALERAEASGLPIYASAIALAEIFAGVRGGEEVATEAFFQARGEIILDAAAGRRAGSYLARYARTHSLEIGDALVAACATTAGLDLWTLNRKHFPMPDVRFFEP